MIVHLPRQPHPSERIEQRRLALHAAMASKIRASPHWLQRARETLQRWILKRSPQVSEDLLEWQNILDTWPLEDILTLLTSPGEEPDRLRKSSPFCGILSEEERAAIFKKHRAIHA